MLGGIFATLHRPTCRRYLGNDSNERIEVKNKDWQNNRRTGHTKLMNPDCLEDGSYGHAFFRTVVEMKAFTSTPASK